MANFNDVLRTVSNAARDIAGKEDSIRSIANSPLVGSSSITLGATGLPREVLRQSERISSGGDVSLTGGSQSDRGIIPPATDNKVPRLYGSVTTGGVITDVYKANANTIFYCFVLSETDLYDQSNTAVTGDLNWELTDIYRDNSRATFSPTTKEVVIRLDELGSSANVGFDVADSVMQVWAWAGGSTAGYQVFPKYAVGSVDRENAYDIFPGWTSSNTMEDLVFAIVRVNAGTYSDWYTAQPVEVKDFGDWRFRAQSMGYNDPTAPPGSLTNWWMFTPASCLYDYLTNSKYGAGLTANDIDYASILEWYNYSTNNDSTAEHLLVQSPTTGGPDSGTAGGYYDLFGGVAGAYDIEVDRWRLNMYVNPQNSVAENIEEICKAGGATFAYDNKQGKFKVLINKEMTAAEEANAFTFNNDNIIGSVTVNSTDLYSLYNFAEVTFPNDALLQQPDTIYVTTPTADKVLNEPTSGMSFSLKGVTNRARAATLANLTLSQSRITNTVTFSADHSSLVVNVGDYIKLTDPGKKFENKWFRVLRTTENIEDDGTLTCDFVCVEYNDRPYRDVVYRDGITDSDATGLYYRDRWAWVDFKSPYSDYNIQLGNIYVVDNPASGFGNIVSPTTGNVITNATVSTLFVNADLTVGEYGPSTTAQYVAVAAPVTTQNNVFTYWQGCITTLERFDYALGVTPAASITQNFDDIENNQFYFAKIPLNKVTTVPGAYYRVTVQFYDDGYAPIAGRNQAWVPYQYSQANTSAWFYIEDRQYNSTMYDNFGIDSYILEQDFSITTNVNNTFPHYYTISNTPYKRYDLARSPTKGKWQWKTYVYTDWNTLSTDSIIAVVPMANITFVNNNNTVSTTHTINGSGFKFSGSGNINAANIKNNYTLLENEFSTEASMYGLDEDWYVSRANVWFTGTSYHINSPNITVSAMQIYNASDEYRYQF